MSALRWVGELVVDGDVAFRVGREGEELIAEWRDLCVLRSDRAGERATFEAASDADARIVAKVRAGLAAALLRHLQGGTTLHASCVARGGRALAFLGKSGAGKSTLAAYMCRARGFELLADDVVRVEIERGRALAYPTEVDHWLEPASLRALGLAVSEDADGPEAKTPLAAATVARAPCELQAVIAVSLEDEAGEAPGADAAAPRITRVRGHRALAQLVPCLVRFVIDEPAAQLGELDRMSALLDAVPFYELNARRDFDGLPVTATRVEELMRACPEVAE